MNEGHGNGANPSLNGRPYYSADNGFACAAAGRGVTEALQEHLNVIVRNEELEIERSHSQIQADIKDLVEDKERLEQRKLDMQDNTKTLTEERAVKEVKISELTTELEAPIKDDSPPSDPRIDMLKNAIDEKTFALEEKQVERVKIKTNLEAPTAAELKPPAVDQTPVSRFSALEKGFAVATVFVLVGLIAYLFIFMLQSETELSQKVSELSRRRKILSFPVLYPMRGINPLKTGTSSRSLLSSSRLHLSSIGLRCIQKSSINWTCGAYSSPPFSLIC